MPPLNLTFLNKVRVAFCPFFNVTACRFWPCAAPHARHVSAVPTAFGGLPRAALEENFWQLAAPGCDAATAVVHGLP